MEYLKDNKFIKMEIKVIKMWKLIKYESDKFKYFHGLRHILNFFQLFNQSKRYVNTQ